MTQRLLRPIVLVALAALALLTARLAVAQQPPHRAAVAARPLARGTVLTADDISFRDTTAQSPADSVSPGWVTRRVISAGEVLRSPAVERPVLVEANSLVQVEWSDKNVRLTLRGIASHDASLGDRISVRTETGRRLQAIVVAPGRARID